MVISLKSCAVGRSRVRGFTLVELLVVISIIAILAGVALGPINRGLKIAKQSAALQTCRTIALSEFQVANDNDGAYPDGTDAGAIAKQMIAGKYVSDPGIFFLSGDRYAARYSGANAATSITAANVSFDFAGVDGVGANSGPVGVGSNAPDQLPVVWSPDRGVTTISPTVGTGLAFAPQNDIFGGDGVAVAYKSGNAFFRAPATKAPKNGSFPPLGQVAFIDPSFDPGSTVYVIRRGAGGGASGSDSFSHGATATTPQAP